MSSRTVVVGVGLGVLGAASTGLGQSFNVDFETGPQGSVWFGGPASTYAGAIDQTGSWARMLFNPNLVGVPGLDGEASGVEMVYSGASAYGTAIAGVSGNALFLLGDGVTGHANAVLGITFVGLRPGAYSVVTYAADPYASDPCTVGVVGSIDPPQSVTGGMNSNALVAGVTHAKHRVVITGDQLRIQAADPSAGGVARVGGVQLRYHGGLGTRLYVDSTVAVSGTGASWATAIKRLDDALIAAELGGVCEEIWVKGTHTPRNHDNPTDRTSTFKLLNGVRLYGGFAGNETSLEQRDPVANVTIFSGNIGGRASDDNCYHVITAEGVFSSARVDGFTVMGGRADGSGFAVGGGAVWIKDANPWFKNCIFRDNFALEGGAVSFFAQQSLARFTNCTFIDNVSQTFGGAVYYRGATGSQVAFGNCRFLGNTAGGYGGAVYALNGPGWLEFYNTVFTGNASTNLQGGAIFAFGSMNDTRLDHCTVTGNRAAAGGGIVNQAGSTVTIDNSIVWGNTDTDLGTSTFEAQLMVGGTITVNYSDVQSLPAFWAGRGPGCISSAPMFVNPDGVDSVFGTLDDDVSLAAGSPCIDAGDNGRITVDYSDVDSDGSLGDIVSIDLAGRARRLDDASVADTGVGGVPVTDMGAYERLSCPADFNDDGFVDFFDYDDYVNCFETGRCPPGTTADFTGDDFVDFFDYAAFVHAFNAGC